MNNATKLTVSTFGTIAGLVDVAGLVAEKQYIAPVFIYPDSFVTY